LPLEINYKERMVEILYTRLLYPHLCTCFKPGLDFQRHMSCFFFMYNELKWEVIVRLVDFGANCCSSLFRTEWPVCTTYAFTSLYNICIHPFVQHMYSPVYTTYVFTSLYNICIHQFVQHIYSPVCTTYVFTSLYNICIHQFVQHMYSPVCTTYIFTSLYNICIHQFVQHMYSPVCTTYVFTSLYNICIHQFVQHMYSWDLHWFNGVMVNVLSSSVSIHDHVKPKDYIS
jgi:hypothetical protein